MGESLVEQSREAAGANQFLVAHCGRTLDDVRNRYRGVLHMVERCNSEYVDCWEAVNVLRAQVAELTCRVTSAEAELGAQRERLDAAETEGRALREALDKARKAYQDLRNHTAG